MLSHAEAQALISSRFDGPLDPVAERVLNAHIATCPSCRAFNLSAGQLARGLRQLPYLPASPAVSRAVLEHVNAPRPPWSRVGLPSLSTMVPALSAAAVALILVLAGAFALIRVQEGDDPETASLNAPSAQSTSEVAQANPTATNAAAIVTSEPDEGPTAPLQANLSDPTATDAAAVPTTGPTPEPTASEPPPPTTGAATDTPAPNETASERAEGDQPSATASVGDNAALSGSEDEVTPSPAPPTEVPSATAEPTATDAPPTETSEPTATDAPTPEPTATDVPPTATAEPTATDAPTTEPTATDVPPTATAEPTATRQPVVETPTQESAAAGIPPGDGTPTATYVPTF